MRHRLWVEISRRRQGEQEIWFVLNHTAQERQIDLPDGLVDLLDREQAVEGSITVLSRSVRVLASAV